MELPKHTTQVGTIAANKKMYLEDYCISYMKQLTEEFPEDRKQIALYGTVEKEKSVEYAFVYGAALLGKGRGRTDSLTSSQKDEAESIRREFFSDYQLVGIVISTDAVNENVFWLGYSNKSIPMDGYYIFYDTNEAMLNFMMENQKEEREIDLDPVIVKKADMDREKREKADREKLEAQQKSGKYRKKIKAAENAKRQEPRRAKSPFPAVACIMLLAICSAYGIKTYYPDFSLERLPSYFADWKEKVVASGKGYLSEDKESDLLVENETTETENTEPEELLIVSAGVQQPAELDVVVMPDLDTLDDDVQQENVSSESAQTQPEEPQATPEPEMAESNETVSESTPQEYYIKKGDNLLKILRAYYGDEGKLQEVIDLNKIIDPNNIQVGQIILLP